MRFKPMYLGFANAAIRKRNSRYTLHLSPTAFVVSTHQSAPDLHTPTWCNCLNVSNLIKDLKFCHYSLLNILFTSVMDWGNPPNGPRFSRGAERSTAGCKRWIRRRRWVTIATCVLRMRANPKPQDTVWLCHPQRSVMYSHAYRPQMLGSPNSLQMQRWVVWIGLEECKILICQLLPFFGQLPVMLPKAG